MWLVGNGRRVAALEAELAQERERVAALALANAQLATAHAELARDRRPPHAVRPALSIRALFDAFKKAHRHRPSWETCEDRLLPLVRRLGDVLATELDPLLWAEHFVARSDERDYRGNLPAPQTLKMELGRAKQMTAWGKRARLLVENLLAEVKPEPVVSQRETWLERTGVERLVGGCHGIKGERQQLITEAFMLCLNDGMLRFNEARVLRHDQIALDGTLTLARRTVKGKKKSRIVTLTPPALAAIRRIPRVLGNPHVFANAETGQPYSEGSLRQWFNTAAAESQIHDLAVPGERVTPHTLRHSGASQADARGATALMLRDGLGHESLRTTERYMHHQKTVSARRLAQLMLRGIDESPSENEEKGSR